jgi:predicted DNA-binding mobile mystery protein A
MNKSKDNLILEHLDKRFKTILKASTSMAVPSNGWINTIRKSLNISLRQLSKKLQVTSQNVNQLERREKDGSISIQKLKEAAEALDCKLVYAIIPNEGSLNKMIAERAHKVAKEIVLRTSHSMKLEDQENSEERIKKAIKERAEKIQNELPKYLWD